VERVPGRSGEDKVRRFRTDGKGAREFRVKEDQEREFQLTGSGSEQNGGQSRQALKTLEAFASTTHPARD